MRFPQLRNLAYALGGLATLATIGAVAGAAVGESESSAHARPSDRSCDLPHAAGEASVPLVSAGVDRPFRLFVPGIYDGRTPLPLVLNLHSSGTNGGEVMRVSDMAAAAERLGVAVVAPNGGVVLGQDQHSWNVPGVPLVSGQPVPAGTPDDERYLLDVIRTTENTICVDPARVQLVGYSGGARMASQMACDFPRKISAIAPVVGLRAGVPKETAPHTWSPNRATCRPAEPVSVVAFHGTADATNHFHGNDDPRWGYSVEAALARWAKVDRCRKGPRSRAVTTIVTLVSYARCKSGASVQLYVENGGEHTWPGGAADTILEFFAQHTPSDRD